MKETNIFEILREPYHLPKKVRLFESFSGLGCQRLAFNRLGLDYESVGISEIDKYAIASYMAIHGETKNFGSICDVKGDELPQIDVFTYSFPCTDLSKAGQQKGMSVGTRSGLVYEVLRILYEAHEVDNLPKVLIMENVVDLIQVKFIKQFQEIQLELEQLGYTNYTETLNAKNYGVAQNRDRVFMVSILGDYYYEFPKPIQLEKKLKDYLEDEVDEKYYLSDKLIGQITNWKSQQNPLENSKTKDDEFIQCITAKSNTSNNASMLLIKEATQKGYSEAYVGDGVYINRPHQKRGVVQDKMIPTLKTSGNDIGVVEFGTYYTWKDKQGNINTQCNRAANENGSALTVACANPGMVYEDKLRIRKLTPKECWRLMGIDDTYFHKAQEVCSSSQLYKQAGNGIVIDVFAKIIEKLI